MTLTSRIGVTCEKTICSFVVAAVILVTVVSITTVVMVASNTSITRMLDFLFSG